jgi:hypothetical protein
MGKLNKQFPSLLVELGGVFERDYTEELIILDVATVSALYPSLYGDHRKSVDERWLLGRRPIVTYIRLPSWRARQRIVCERSR